METDWDNYYKKPYKAAKYSRAITQNILLRLIQQFKPSVDFTIAELGGANSCFFTAIQQKTTPKEYHIIDNNQVGLDKFKQRITNLDAVFLHQQDILNLHSHDPVDIAFSIGLIEHFSLAGTKKAIQAHYDMVKPNGIIIISFPTPTLLYKLTRYAAECAQAWIFHDERPLPIPEVVRNMQSGGTICYQKTIWPIFLTQHIIVAKKI